MYFIFRKNGGQVLLITTDLSVAQSWQGSFTDFVQDPSTPDGADLSIPKIWDGVHVRNAVALEIANFTVAQSTDDNLQQRTNALNIYLSDPNFRKLMRAFAFVLLGQINTLRTKAALPTLQMSDVQTALQNAINSGNFD